MKGTLKVAAHAPPSPAPPSPAPISPLPDRTTAGIVLMLLAMFAFSLNDVMGKWLMGTYGVAQLLLLRSISATVVLAPAFWRTGWRTLIMVDQPWLHVARAICSVSEVAFFYWAVTYLPLADTVAFYLACPIFVTILAVIFLKEQVGWRRWLAVIVGFIGVIIAINPTGASSVGWPALIALGGCLLFAGLNVLTRKLAATNEFTLVFWQLAGAILFGLVVAPFRWVPPTGFDLLCLALLGIAGTLAHMATNRSLSYAPAAVVVPYQYSIILWASLFGFIFFGDVPGWNVVVGSVIIVAAGLYIFIREQIRAREKAAQHPSV